MPDCSNIMKKGLISALLLGLSAQSIGCSDFESRASRENTKLHYRSGEIATGEILEVRDSVVSFALGPPDPKIVDIEWRHIKMIELANDGSAILWSGLGFSIGLGAGIGAGYLVAKSESDDRNSNAANFDINFDHLVLPAIIVTLGAVAGTTIGYSSSTKSRKIPIERPEDLRRVEPYAQVRRPMQESNGNP